MTIRDAALDDLEEILILNELVVPAVNSLSHERMRWFLDHAAHFRVLEDDGIAAFLIGFLDGSNYESANYRWFSTRYERFAYVDRVAVQPAARRAGHAGSLYSDFVARLPGDIAVLTCEVNIRPPNPGSIRFHERRGFEEVGRQQTERGAKEVSLLALSLRSTPRLDTPQD